MVVRSITLLVELHAEIPIEGIWKTLHPLPKRTPYSMVLDITRIGTKVEGRATSNVGPTPDESANVAAANTY